MLLRAYWIACDILRQKLKKQSNGRINKNIATTLEGQMYTKYTNNNNVNNLFTFTEISRMQRHSVSSELIRLLTLRYKRHDKTGNGN